VRKGLALAIVFGLLRPQAASANHCVRIRSSADAPGLFTQSCSAVMAADFVVPPDEIDRCMVDDPRLTRAVSDFHFERDTVIIIGGGGFVGAHIGRMLASCGGAPKELRLFDLGSPRTEDVAAMSRTCSVVPLRGDVSNANHVDDAIAGCTVVIHVASYGMSGKEMLNVRRIRSVNLQGTMHVLAACQRHRVRSLVYTSSYNAVFSGKPFSAALDCPYPLPSDFSDEYSRTKSAAEQMVLQANGERGLHTVALRMAGIYGVGEQRHFPRIIRLVRLGAVKMTIGGLQSRQDWVSIGNAAYAHVLAAHRLVRSPAGVAGRAFPISDHHPINQYRMLEPLFVALGQPLPRLGLPVPVAMAIATVVDLLLIAANPIVQIEPVLTRGEILKVSTEHHFAPEASVNGLGYRPVVPFHEGMARTIAHFIAAAKRGENRHLSKFPHGRFAIGAVLALILVFALVALNVTPW
jgi:nucleoside-diphosphate-sugar epimerase